MRQYPTPDGDLYSVTSILEATMTAAQKNTLKKWREREAATSSNSTETARDRGTAVHSIREDYFKGEEIPLLEESDELSPFVNYLKGLLLPWDRERHIWCEHPIGGAYSECWTQPWDGKGTDQYLPTGNLWSKTLGYAGCPDDIGYYNDRLALADLKTSRRPYYRIKPEVPAKSIWWKAKCGDEDAIKYIEIFREQNSGYLTYWKCCLQIAAYSLLVKERLKLEPEDWLVLVVSPGRAQKFVLTETEKSAALLEWNTRLQQFHWNLQKAEAKAVKKVKSKGRQVAQVG